MRTSLNIPDDLLEDVQKAAGTETRTQAIVLALQDFVQRKKLKRLHELKGSMKDSHDYKSLRKKR